jgi:hypothetical protein
LAGGRRRRDGRRHPDMPHTVAPAALVRGRRRRGDGCRFRPRRRRGR